MQVGSGRVGGGGGAAAAAAAASAAAVPRTGGGGGRKVVQSALAVVPRGTTALFRRVQELRRVHDRQVRRWPPHMNLLYPFVPEAEFYEAAQTLSEAFRAHGGVGDGACVVHMEGMHFFQHAKSATVFLQPDTESQALLQEMQAVAEAAVPHCNDVSQFRGGFSPHLTLAQRRNATQAANFIEIEEFDSAADYATFPVSEVLLMSRKGQDDPFVVRYRVDIQTGEVQRHEATDLVSFPGYELEDVANDTRPVFEGGGAAKTDSNGRSGGGGGGSGGKNARRNNKKARVQQEETASMDGLDFQEVDGAQLEGGGQVLRVSLAAAAVLSRPVRVHSIRAGRSRPGLGNQHLTGVRLLAQCTQGGRLSGDRVGSTDLRFASGPSLAAALPPAPPSTSAEVVVSAATATEVREAPAEVEADPDAERGPGSQPEAEAEAEPEVVTGNTGTAGSCMLLVQVTLLPSLLHRRVPVTLRLSGGTNASFAPPVDHFVYVLRPWLQRFGVSEANLQVQLTRRGYYPAGGGLVDVTIRPVAHLQPVRALHRGARLESVRVNIYGNVSAAEKLQCRKSVERMLASELSAAGHAPQVCSVQVCTEEPQHNGSDLAAAAGHDGHHGGRGGGRGGGQGGERGGRNKKRGRNNRNRNSNGQAVTLGAQATLQFDRDGLCTADALLEGRNLHYGPEEVQGALARSIAGCLEQQAVVVDEHTADQLVLAMALAPSVSHVVVPSEAACTSLHLPTAITIATQMTGASFVLTPFIPTTAESALEQLADDVEVLLNGDGVATVTGAATETGDTSTWPRLLSCRGIAHQNA